MQTANVSLPAVLLLKLKYFKLIPQDAKQIATKAILKIAFLKNTSGALNLDLNSLEI